VQFKREDKEMAAQLVQISGKEVWSLQIDFARYHAPTLNLSIINSTCQTFNHACHSPTQRLPYAYFPPSFSHHFWIPLPSRSLPTSLHVQRPNLDPTSIKDQISFKNPTSIRSAAGTFRFAILFRVFSRTHKKHHSSTRRA
jgi:hypothetical protein